MTQRHTVLIVILLLLGGLVAAGISQFNQDSQEGQLPTPTPAEILFNRSTPAQSIQPQKQRFKQYSKFPGVFSVADLKDKKAVLETSKGVIEFEIYPEATKAASNFIFLVQDEFYDGLIFHRVEPGFVVQGGDPLGNGTGGPGYTFEDEPVTRSYDQGIVAMANAGPDTNGSQFFIMLSARRDLPPRYTIFGKVTQGMEVVERIQVGDRIKKATVSAM